MIYLAVMIGGGLGSLLRFLISSFGFLPFATVFINIIGSLILGFLTFFFLDRPEIPPELRFGLTAGFCGGFTTFSTFSVEVYAMVLDNRTCLIAYFLDYCTDDTARTLRSSYRAPEFCHFDETI